MKFNDVKVYKMGPKLGFGFSKFYFSKGAFVKIKITKGNKTKSFRNLSQQKLEFSSN